MPTELDTLRHQLRWALPVASRYLLALSGGRDSAGLLHALAGLPGLRTVYVEHGLGPWGDALARAARNCAAQCGVPHTQLGVREPAPDTNVEDWARRQRYAVLAAELGSGEVLITAHHQDDLAEGFLLAALRGSGPAGLRSMTALQPFAAGWLARPALGVPQASLRAAARPMPSFDDPSNDDTRYRRNALRDEIVPALQGLVPGAAASLARSARLQAQQQATEAWLLREALARMAAAAPASWQLASLLAAPAPVCQALLRAACRQQGAPSPPAAVLEQFVAQMSSPRADAEPMLNWRGWSLRRYRLAVHLVPPLPQAPDCMPTPGTADIDWYAGGRLRLQAPAGCRLLSGRTAGRLQRAGRGSVGLKNFWQQLGVPPWVRAHWPQLQSAEGWLCVADCHVDAIRDVNEFRWLGAPPWARYWVEQARKQSFG